MPSLLLATRNKHKVRELFQLLGGQAELVDLSRFPAVAETVEDQPTLEGNAGKKAREAALGSGLWALADDTGLEVESLNGAPGVYSARYAGPGCTYADNNAKLLKALAGLPAERRRAVFRTVMALCSPRGEVTLAEGRLEGVIAEAPAGENGFGYDPVFYVPAQEKTLAQLSPERKNQLSHRFRALQAILPHVRRALAVAALAVLVMARPARADKTEPGQETIWDQIMASQARRELSRGSQFLDNKSYDLAVKEFSRAVAANPDDPMAYMMLGVAHYWTGDVDQSLQDYNKSLGLDPNSAQTHMLIGISLAWKGQTQQAYAEFQKAAQLEPGRPDIQMNLGSIEDSLGLTPQAMDHFRRAASLAPKEPLYHYQLGMLYRKLGRDSDAAEELRQSLKYYPDFEDALLELGAVDERRGDLKSAVRDFKKAVDLKNRDAVARFRLGRLYLAMGDVKSARAVFGEAFHLTPEEGGPGLQLSVSYAGGKVQEPEADGSKSQAPTPNASPKGRQDGAAPAPPAPNPNDPLEVFRRNLERVPLDQAALLQVDVIFAPRPKLVKADAESRSSLRRALERQMRPSSEAPKALRRQYDISAGDDRQRAAQIDKIIADLKQTMQQAPENSDVRLGMNLTFKHLESAQTAGGLAGMPGGGIGGSGAAGSARADAGSQPKVSYEPRQVGNDLGLWIIGTGWMALVDEVLPDPGEQPAHPERSDSWVAAGLGFATIGDGARALDAFEHALQLDGSNEIAYLGRGVAHVMLGDDDAAIASFRQALKLNPRDRAAGEGLKWLLRPVASSSSRARAQ